MDPTLEALRAQQKTIRHQAEVIKTQDRRIARAEQRLSALHGGFVAIAKAAGIQAEPRIAALIRTADSDNPAQPVDDKPAEAPAVTTEEAKTPAATTDLESDEAVLTDVSPAAQTSLGSDEVVLDQPLNLNQQDVEAPVKGADNPGDLKVETDVRQTDSSDEVMDEWHLSSKGGSERAIAAMRLARLRIATGQSGDDLDISSAITADASMTADRIQQEIDVLSRVVESAPRQQVSATRQTPAPRMAPSLAAVGGGGSRSTGSILDDEVAFE